MFIEFSSDYYTNKYNISTTVLKSRTCKKCGSGLASIPTDMSLKEKIDAVAAAMEGKSIITKNELVGIRKLMTSLLIDLNSYTHNKDYNPKPPELHMAWDDIQSFIERLWYP